MERAITTALPLAFLAQLLASEAVLAGRRIDLAGQPPIDRRPFLACKYAAIGVWLAVSLQSWGIGWQPLTGGPALRELSVGLWVSGFALLFLGRLNLGGHLRIGLADEATALHRRGVYRFTRNPMYAGIDATMVAAVLYTLNPAIAILGAFVVAVHHRIILAEERWLNARFGEEYDRYRESVGRYATLPGADRTRALWNLLKMGHCAPTVMRSVLDASGRKEEWLVRLVAGLPGGIGNTGGECGGVTSPLVLLGLRHGLGRVEEGLPLVFRQGHDQVRRFCGRHGTLLCREIRGIPPRILPCVGVVWHSPKIYADVLASESRRCIAGEARDAYSRLYAAFAGSGFHCAQSVLKRLGEPVCEELLNGAGAFLGGTLFRGMTCSALAAGVMALGLRTGEIESSPWRVLRMVVLLLTGGRAFEDGVNKFNRAMNRGGELAAWFAAEVGSTQCRAITHADFSVTADVEAYVRRGGIAECRGIAEKVAERVRLMVDTGPS